LLGSAAAYAAEPSAPAAGNLSPQAAQRAPATPDFTGLVKVVKPAVVSVRVRADFSPQVMSSEGGSNPFEGTPFEFFFKEYGQRGMARPPHFAQAQGSGFFISADGYIVTNNHVIDRANKVQVLMDDGSQLEAQVVGADKKTDLALLKVEGRNDFPYVKFADAKPQIGEWVVAMGNPFGLGGTVTAGIVSAQGRDIGSGPYDDYLQIDAAVNRGNSGGPTFNMNGRVVGVNTAIYSPSGGSIGIAFDIPASTANYVVQQLKDHGSVERGWLGVKVQAVTPQIAESLGLDKVRGALVAEAESGTAAAKAGLRPGDVITSVNEHAVKDSRDLARQIATTAPNSEVAINFIRDGKSQTVTATLARMQQPSPRVTAKHRDDEQQTDKLGLTVAPAAEVEGAGRHGLAVLNVAPGSKAAELGFEAGDVILKAGNQDVNGVAALEHSIQTAEARGLLNVLVLVRRGDNQRFVAMPLSAG
jgi:serine protease Do